MNLLDIAYEVAKKNFTDKSKGFSFKELWKDTMQEVGIKSASAKDEMGDFYAGLIEDARFVLIGKQKWILRESMTFGEFDKLSKAMFNDEEVLEEGYEDYVDLSLEDEGETPKESVDEDDEEFSEDVFDDILNEEV